MFIYYMSACQYACQLVHMEPNLSDRDYNEIYFDASDPHHRSTMKGAGDSGALRLFRNDWV